jgi:tetratricopeptide (TPR) repeat protein
MASIETLPKIQVGRDFTMGDVSGQVAIGTGNVQYQNCVFNLPDGSTLSGQSWLYTQGIRPSTDPAKIFGRQEELEKIDELFKHNSALALTGFRGTGKSTLASMYIDRLEKRGEFAGIYWRKVDETIDISDVVSSFFSVIGKPIEDLERYKIGDQLTLLFRELNAAPYFLVLDNFEVILDPRTNEPEAHKLGFSELIENATENAGKSRFLFTSWESPASERGIRPTCYTIGGLDPSAAVRLLKRNGLTEPDTELEQAVKLAGGHPLALILLTQLIKGGADTLSDLLKDTALWMGEKGEVAERILDKVYKERLDEDERKLLQYVSLYRVPVPLQAIVIAAHDSQWTEAAVKKITLSLIRKSLLQKTGENYWEESLIDTYAYSKLVDRIEAHNRAYQYYISLPLPEPRTKKDDVQSLIEAHHHACLAQQYDTAADILFDHDLHEDLDRWGYSRTLIELYSGLLPKDQFNDKPVLTSKKTHGAVLGSLGLAYSHLGQVEKAIEYYEQALVISREIGDRRNEGNHLGNLGSAYYHLGQVEKAIQYYEQALVIAREIGDRRGEGNALSNIGNAYRDLGQVVKAIEYHELALVIAREIGDRRGEGSDLGNLGNAYYQLDQVDKAIEYYEQALVIAREIHDRRGEGTGLGNLGNAYYQLGQVDKAIEYHEQAMVISQEIGDRRGEGNALGSLGNAYSDLGLVKKAIEYHEQAMVISQEIGDRRGEGIWLGNLGNAYYQLGQVDKAIEYYEQAMVIGKEIKDPRIIDFCENNLKNLSPTLNLIPEENITKKPWWQFWKST